MMTNGDVSARTPPVASPGTGDNSPGQTAMAEFLGAQSEVPDRSLLARLFGLSPLTSQTRPLYHAAVGEIQVGDALDRLGDDWVVTHALPVGAGNIDIDHLVIGPGGVYVVNTRNHTGQAVWASQRTFMVAGIRYPHVRNMEYEMGRVERLLSAAVEHPVEVSGILAIVSPKNLTVRQEHRDVAIVSSGSLVSWLRGRREVLARDAVQEIGSAALLDSTWHQSDEPPVDRAIVRERFECVRRSVRSAWRIQLAWASATTLAGGGGFVLLTYAIFLRAVGMP